MTMNFAIWHHFCDWTPVSFFQMFIFITTHNWPVELAYGLSFLSCFVGWKDFPSQILCQVWSGLVMQGGQRQACSLNLFKLHFSLIPSFHSLFICFDFSKCLLLLHLGPKSPQLLSLQQKNLPNWWGRFLPTLTLMMTHLVEVVARYHPVRTLVLPPQLMERQMGLLPHLDLCGPMNSLQISWIYFHTKRRLSKSLSR